MANAATTRTEAGINMPDGPQPPAGSLPAPRPPSLEELLALGRHYRDLGLILPSASTMGTSPATVELRASGGKRRVARGDGAHEADMDASSAAQVTDDRPGVSSAGHPAPAEALPAISTLPSEAALLELALQMLTGGSGEPAAPAEHYEPAADSRSEENSAEEVVTSGGTSAQPLSGALGPQQQSTMLGPL